MPSYTEARMFDSVSSPPADELLSEIVRAIVDRPHSVVVTSTRDDATDTFTIRVHPEDIGKIVGKHGQIIKAVRTVMGGAGMKKRRRCVIILDDADHSVEELPSDLRPTHSTDTQQGLSAQH
jgi:uncharacterized protein